MLFTAGARPVPASRRASSSRSEINPYADEWEAAGIFPAHELFPKLGAIGALGLEYDEEYGGGGRRPLVHRRPRRGARVALDMRRVCPMAIAVQAAWPRPALAPVRLRGAEAASSSRPRMRGELVCSIARHRAGRRVGRRGHPHPRARRDGDDWVINGRKMWITNGTQADWICLLARTSDEGGYQGMSMIIVPTDTPGFSVGRKLKKMGNHSSDTAELVLDDVRVPVPTRSARSRPRLPACRWRSSRTSGCRSLHGGRPAPGGPSTAPSSTCSMREAFGKPLLANQYIQYTLAELVAEIDMLHGLLHHTAPSAYMARRGRHAVATIAKLKSRPPQSAKVADACVQFHGGMGYAEELLGRPLLPRLPAGSASAAAPTRSCCGSSRCSRAWGSDDVGLTRTRRAARGRR